MSTCEKCGRTSDDWVAYSHQVGAEVCWDCHQKGIDAEAEAQTAVHEHIPPEVVSGTTSEPDDPATEEIRIVGAAEFAAVDEPGAEPLVGSENQVLIPEGGDAMIYGDGGASKTTLGIDLGCHLAAGDEWLEAPVPKPVRVGLIEAEGPRALFRRKLRRKLEQWAGSEIGDRLQVLESPWAAFRFPAPTR